MAGRSVPAKGRDRAAEEERARQGVLHVDDVMYQLKDLPYAYSAESIAQNNGGTGWDTAFCTEEKDFLSQACFTKDDCNSEFKHMRAVMALDVSVEDALDCFIPKTEDASSKPRNPLQSDSIDGGRKM